VATATAERSQPQRGVFWRGLRIVASYVAMHPLPFIISVSGAALYAGMTVASTVVLGHITDSVLVPAFHQGSTASSVVAAVVAILGVAVLRALGIVTRRYFAGMTQHRVQRTLRLRVIERYAQLPLAYHQSKPTGELLAHTQADVTAATEVVGPLPYSTAVVLLIVFATVSMLVADPFLAAVGCITLPGLALLNHAYGARVEAPQTRAQQRIGDVSSVAHESIDGALVVKTLGRQSAEVQRFRAVADALRTERVTVGRLRAAFEPALDTLPDLAMVALLAVGSWRVSTGAITTGGLVQFVSLFQLLAFPMRVIGFVLADVPRAVVGRERLEEVFTEPIAVRPAGASATPVPPGPLALAVDSVSYGFADNLVLDGVRFEVRPSESVALVGPTGAGKSTLAELMVRLDDPQRGSISIGGINLRNAETASLRAAVAIVFQESFLFATTVRENIALGYEAGDDEVIHAARIAQAHDFISEMPHGYETVLGERGVTVSGGQRQRIALARALLRRPRLLILDDATSAVDATVEAAILDALRKQVDTTLVVVAYRVSTIALADRVLLLEDGRISASGTHSQLLRHPTYAAMVQAYERVAV
jgi:ATP-binding cassette subfamily B protein